MNMREPQKIQLANWRIGVICPFCGELIGVNTLNKYICYNSLRYQFKDDLSIKEFFQSNLCQRCQDDFFDA